MRTLSHPLYTPRDATLALSSALARDISAKLMAAADMQPRRVAQQVRPYRGENNLFSRALSERGGKKSRARARGAAILMTIVKKRERERGRELTTGPKIRRTAERER